jgi:hypothetical protein
MSQSSIKRAKRSMRQEFRKIGLSPEALQARAQKLAEAELEKRVIAAAPKIRARPRWVPHFAWNKLLGWLIK